MIAEDPVIGSSETRSTFMNVGSYVVLAILISVLCFFTTLRVFLATDSGIKSGAHTDKKKKS